MIRPGSTDEETDCRLELRQDFHTLFWTRHGHVRQFVDGEPLDVDTAMLTLVGRGQVYRYEHTSEPDGAIISFGEDLLYEGSVTQTSPVSLIGRFGAQSVRVPPEDVARVDRLVEILDTEARHPTDARSLDIQRHLLLTLLLWIERLYDASSPLRPSGNDAEVRLHRRFTALLERDFARHHDVGHYADTLGVHPSMLSRALSNSTGLSTKALITERIMTEAARLLRFTDLQIGEIASRVGLQSQFHFSRMFKQRHGESPQAFRARVQDGAVPNLASESGRK